MVFYKIILTTSALSSTNLGSILIFASGVLHRSSVLSKFHESGPKIRCNTWIRYNMIFYDAACHVRSFVHNTDIPGIYIYICIYTLGTPIQERPVTRRNKLSTHCSYL